MFVYWGHFVSLESSHYFYFLFLDYELIMDSDILPNRTAGSAWTTGGFESHEPAQFEERHLKFLQLLGKVSLVCDPQLHRGRCNTTLLQ